jgi:DNA polymerase III delta' subunit
MSLLLHPTTAAQLESLLHATGRSYIFHGPSGMGKATAAQDLARRLNCDGDSSGPCAACRRFQAGANPDIVTLAPADKPSITIEQVRGVLHALSLSPHRSTGRRVIIIDSAHALTLEAQNALLKLIEEPPAATIFILVVEHAEALLPTIRSRCAAIFFAPVPNTDIATLLTSSHGIPGANAAAISATASGAPGAAITLAGQPEQAAARLELTRQAAATPGMSPFARLLLAKRLIDTKADLALFGRLLQSGLTSQIQSGHDTIDSVAPRLQALERFRHQLLAKVAPRVALESLMLEL